MAAFIIHLCSIYIIIKCIHYTTDYREFQEFRRFRTQKEPQAKSPAVYILMLKFVEAAFFSRISNSISEIIYKFLSNCTCNNEFLIAVLKIKSKTASIFVFETSEKVVKYSSSSQNVSHFISINFG